MGFKIGKEDHMQREKLWIPEFLGMGGSNLFLFMSQYIMVAALPIFIMDTLGGGDMEAGLAMTAFQIGAVSCRPLAGRIIDAVNKQKLMRGATAAFFLVMFAFNWFHSEQAIYALRLLHGCIFALATTAAATMAALVLPASRKGEGIGYFALSTNLAMVVGPLIGLLLIGNLGGTALFAFMTALAILTFLTANARRLPDEVVCPAKRPKKGFHLSDFIERRSLAPALLGGLTSSVYEDGVVYSVKRDVDQSLCFAAIVPDYKLLTEAARAALPKQVAHKDAVYNLSRAALVPAAFCEGRHDLLGIATEDKLHQPYRMPLMPGSREVFALAKQCGAKAVYVSGAGSTVMAVAERAEAERFYAGLRAGLETLEGLDGCEAFTLLELDADNTGATVE